MSPRKCWPALFLVALLMPFAIVEAVAVSGCS